MPGDTDNGDNRSGPRAWLRWFLFAEGLILLLAVAGPGSSYTLHRHSDHGLLARMVMEEPDFLDAVVVNFAALHGFIVAAWLLAWLVTRMRRDG